MGFSAKISCWITCLLYEIIRLYQNIECCEPQALSVMSEDSSKFILTYFVEF